VKLNGDHDGLDQLNCLRRKGVGIDDRSYACANAARRPDALTGQPHRAEAVSDDVLRVCVEFNTPLSRRWWAIRDDFDPDTDPRAASKNA
jgi:hypothetical protein